MQENQYVSFRAALREIESLEDLDHLIESIEPKELSWLHADIEQRQAELAQVA